MAVKIYKDGIYKSVPDNQVASYEAKGFSRVDKNGRPVARSADAKALAKELGKANDVLEAANARIAELEEALGKANARIAELEEPPKE